MFANVQVKLIMELFLHRSDSCPAVILTHNLINIFTALKCKINENLQCCNAYSCKKKKQVGCSRTGHGSSRNIIITTGSYYKGNIKGELVNKLKC